VHSPPTPSDPVGKKQSMNTSFESQLFNRDWLEVREKGESSSFYILNPIVSPP
jgi:hypothetical protein